MPSAQAQAALPDCSAAAGTAYQTHLKWSCRDLSSVAARLLRRVVSLLRQSWQCAVSICFRGPQSTNRNLTFAVVSSRWISSYRLQDSTQHRRDGRTVANWCSSARRHAGRSPALLSQRQQVHLHNHASTFHTTSKMTCGTGAYLLVEVFLDVQFIG